MKKLLGMDKDTFIPLSAVFAFVAMIAILFMAKRSGMNTYVGYPAVRRYGIIPSTIGVKGQRRRSVPVSNVHPRWRRIAMRGRRVPSRALIGRGWHRGWDKISGSSRYSKGMLHGRKMGAHIALA
jgi:hypothetical protein